MTELTRFEMREPREDEHAAHIIEVMRRRQKKLYARGATLRDAHTKQTALVRAVFTVEPDLPPELRIGLFASPGRYDAWVRFSNASDTAGSDATRDLRGAAIKLEGVKGERIPESDEPTTQDFVLINAPAMPLGTVALFHDAIYLVTEKSPLHFVAKMLLTGHLRAVTGMKRLEVRPPSPAEIGYFSATPYLLGLDQVAKYALVPTSGHRSVVPDKPSACYLSRNLQQHLDRADATFDFMVQLRTDPETMPVENAAILWRSPFRKVAELRIPRQDFGTAERAALAEVLAFSPAHALAEHRPIGALNRVRMRIYREQSAFRHQRDMRAAPV